MFLKPFMCNLYSKAWSCSKMPLSLWKNCYHERVLHVVFTSFEVDSIWHSTFNVDVGTQCFSAEHTHIIRLPTTVCFPRVHSGEITYPDWSVTYTQPLNLFRRKQDSLNQVISLPLIQISVLSHVRSWYFHRLTLVNMYTLTGL